MSTFEAADEIRIRVNGEERSVPRGTTLGDLLERLDVDRRGVAVERNQRIVPRDDVDDVALEPEDTLEIVRFVGGGRTATPRARGLDDPLEIAGRRFASRLIAGTGKYDDLDVMVEALRAADPAMVTVAVRRADLDAPADQSLLAHLDPEEFFLLPNTAGCHTAEEALRYARLGREAGLDDWVKLEVVGDEETLFPDVEETLKAARALVDEGFTVLAYTNDDLVTALKLEEAGVAAVMPLASPIGSGLGLLNPVNVRLLKRRLRVPVIVDAGVGTASDACETMEQGVDGILMNTALAEADRPVLMAAAMRRAVEAGRMAYLAGRMSRREWAVPSSPTSGMLE